MHKAAISNSVWWNVLPHPPWNPDFAHSQLHLLGRVKFALRGSSFEVDDEMKNGSADSAKT
jgi:hypothetical protein